MTAGDEQLAYAATFIGARHNSMIDASFVTSSNIMIKWRKTPRGYVIYISDLLNEASSDVLSDYIERSIFPSSRTSKFFGEMYLNYIRSEEFILSKRPDVIRRMKGIIRSDVGQYRNLFDSVERLMQMGLLSDSDIQNSVFTWSRVKSSKRLGYCQNIFRIVVISAIFDDPSVPEVFLDQVVYHECIHLRVGYRPNCHSYHDADFKRQMDLFPDNKKVDHELTLFLKENIWTKKYSKK